MRVREISIINVQKEIAFRVRKENYFRIYFKERKNGVILTYKVESLAELKFDPVFRVIREYLCQIDSKIRVNLT